MLLLGKLAPYRRGENRAIGEKKLSTKITVSEKRMSVGVAERK